MREDDVRHEDKAPDHHLARRDKRDIHSIGFGSRDIQVPSGFLRRGNLFLSNHTYVSNLTVEGNKVHIEVLQNPGATLPYGRGRTAVQLLRNRGVDVVVTSEFGPGASALLEQSKIDRVIVRAGTRVGDVIRDKLYKKRKRVRRVKHKLVGD